MKSVRYLLIVVVTLLAVNLWTMLRGNTARAQNSGSGKYKVIVFQSTPDTKAILEKELNDPEGHWGGVSVHLAARTGDWSLAILHK